MAEPRNSRLQARYALEPDVSIPSQEVSFYLASAQRPRLPFAFQIAREGGLALNDNVGSCVEGIPIPATRSSSKSKTVGVTCEADYDDANRPLSPKKRSADGYHALPNVAAICATRSARLPLPSQASVQCRGGGRTGQPSEAFWRWRSALAIGSEPKGFLGGSMARHTTPEERRSRAAETNRIAMEHIERELEASRSKTAKLKELRLANAIAEPTESARKPKSRLRNTRRKA